jgi:hypothetical protein
MTKYLRAHGLNNALTDDDVKRLWKLHFAKQINMAEQQLIISFRRSRLTPNELGRITTLTTGVFARHSHHDKALYQVRRFI